MAKKAERTVEVIRAEMVELDGTLLALDSECEQIVTRMAGAPAADHAADEQRVISIGVQQKTLARRRGLLESELAEAERMSAFAEYERLYKVGHEYYTAIAAIDKEVRAAQERISELARQKSALSSDYGVPRNRRIALWQALQDDPDFEAFDRELRKKYAVEGYY